MSDIPNKFFPVATMKYVGEKYNRRVLKKKMM
jgi:hypothetical protein